MAAREGPWRRERPGPAEGTRPKRVSPTTCFLCGRPFSEADGPIIGSEDETVLLCGVCEMPYQHPRGCCG